MSELIKFCNCIVNRMEVEVSGNIVGLHIVCRVLNRTEVVNFACSRYNNHTARVLTRCTLNARTAESKSLDFSLMKNHTLIVGITLYIADSGFFRNGRNSTRLKHIVFNEQYLRVSVSF